MGAEFLFYECASVYLPDPSAIKQSGQVRQIPVGGEFHSGMDGRV